MPHGNAPARRRGEVYLFPQVAACVVNVLKTPDRALEVRTVFARNPASQDGTIRGRAMMRRAHVTVRPSNVTVIRAQSKRVVRPRKVAPETPEDARTLALITSPCITRIESERLLNTWDEYPLAVLSGNKTVPSVVVAKELAPIACARLSASDEDVLDVLDTQKHWLEKASESAIVLARGGVVKRVWHYDRATGVCSERRATVYSSSNAPPEIKSSS